MTFSRYTVPVLIILGIASSPSILQAQNTTGTAPLTTATVSSEAESSPSTTGAVEATTQPANVAPPANDTETTGPSESQSVMPVSGGVTETTDTVVTTASAALADDEPSTAGITGETQTPVTADIGSSVTLPEGVIYQVIKPGTGETANTSSTLLIHYALYKTDGTQIESSRDQQFPLPFQFTPGTGEAIKGMELGTRGMRVGEQRKLFIPSRLAYGSKGQAPRIPPDSDLIFEIELVDIK